MPVKTRDAFHAELDKLKPEQKIALGELINTDPKLVDLKNLTQVFKRREALLSFLQAAENYHESRDPERAEYFAELQKHLAFTELLKRLTTSNK